MNEFDKFKNYMSKVGAIYTPRKDNFSPDFKLGRCLHIQIQSSEDQHETGLISAHVCLRKEGGFYFPLGEEWAIGALKLVEKIEHLLVGYNLHYNLVINACW